MRIVIDMQGAQTESRYRGIGRYTMSFAQAIVRNRGEHDIILALNGLFPDTIEPIRSKFYNLLKQDNIRIWHAPSPVMESCPGNDVYRNIAELLRESFLLSLSPDVIHITSLFEGYIDNAVTSIGRFDCNTPISVSMYDLIPLLNPEHYLKSTKLFSNYYERKLEYLKKASVYLAISESSRQEGLTFLKGKEKKIINVSTAIEKEFRSIQIDKASETQLLEKFGITHSFVLYTGGADERKNLPRLIEAFSSLAPELKNNHQLLLAGQIHDTLSLQKHAKSVGMNADMLRFTGYVTDDELIQLYNSCKLFVFPSWQEGFGLPALEAMACGAPVIGSNTSSIPEVIDLDAALFDPHDVISITSKLSNALADEKFRSMLIEHGKEQAKCFSWNKTAKRAIEAWQSLVSKEKKKYNYIENSTDPNKLIKKISKELNSSNESLLVSIASSLSKNQNAGIERQLIIDISELVQRDPATGVQRVVRSYLRELLCSPPFGFRVEPVYATINDCYRYARKFTQGFLANETKTLNDKPLRWQRGDVFFCLDMQHHIQLANANFFKRLRNDGVIVKFLVYDLLPIQLVNFFNDKNLKELHERWLEMIAQTDGAICISKSTADAYDTWLKKKSISKETNFRLSWVHIGGNFEASKPSSGMPANASIVLEKMRTRPTFLCVATLEPRKGQEQIVNAFELLWKEGLDVNLVLVGKKGWKMEKFADSINKHPEKNKRFFWLEAISDEYLEHVYKASTCLVLASINEGFGLPLIEAARHKVSIIARDVEVFREVAGDCAFYFNSQLPSKLATAIKEWLELYRGGKNPKSNELSWLTWKQSTEKLKIELVQRNYQRKQLLVDVSELAVSDAKTGIQRVVRNILTELLEQKSLSGYRIEPVYATVNQGYRYASKFKQAFLGLTDNVFEDEPIEYAPGDFFLGLDLNHHVPRVHDSFLKEMNSSGVTVMFVVYDLLPIHFPQFWEPQHSVHLVHEQWLKIITQFDGAFCISKSVADELSQWLKQNGKERGRPFRIDWFHLGADINNSDYSKGIPEESTIVFEKLYGKCNFLMVGTLEPRKGYEQVLAAFEVLWRSNQEINLIIVGKEGWMVERLINQLRAHAELNRHLFWLDGISDEYLEKIYSSCTCLIAASYGEGFGLPLIEAAQHELPIIARDIPVFREVAGEHAFYFDAETPDQLAQDIQIWLSFYKKEKHPLSIDMPWLTWEESAKKLCNKLV